VQVTNETNIKQRLTGAIVLIALAVIFLPLILDGQKKQQILESQIPDKPISGEIILVNIDKQKHQQQEHEQPEVKAESEASEIIKAKEITPQKVKEVVVDKQPISTAVDATKVQKNQPRIDRPSYKSSAFVIQVGSFGSSSNANKLIKKLKAAGYKAYLRKGQSNGKTINRVLVGPELKRSNAESKLSKLNKISGLNSMIVTYDPLKH